MKIKIIPVGLVLLLIGSNAFGVDKLTKITFLPEDGKEAILNLNLPSPHDYRHFSLKQPRRIVLDLYDTVYACQKEELLVDHPIVRSIRSAQHEDKPEKISRVVVDLKVPAQYEIESFPNKLSLKILSGKVVVSSPGPQLQNLVSLDFKDADIKVVIKAISELTKKNFVIDDKVRGKVTIISPTKIPLDEVYHVLESVLEVKGYTTVPAGEIIKVVSAREAKGKGIEIGVGKEIARISPDDKIITQIIPLEYAASENVRSLLTPFLSPGGNLTVYSPTNTIIITDVSSNLRRIISIVNKVDKQLPPRPEMIRVYYLKNALAEDLAKVLTEMYTKMKARRVTKAKARDIEAKPTVVGDKLTNALIIIASSSQYEELKKIIAKLDIPRQQVLVEAMVAEVTLEKLVNLGVEWAAVEEFRPGKAHQPFGGTSFGMRPELLTGTLYGMTLGAYKDNETNIGGLLNLYLSDSDFNILSTPYLLTNNNQEAEIKVGKRVPMITGSRVTEDETVVKTYTYEDVGINLKITPQINPDGFVTLKIHQEIQKILAETIHEAPVLAKRETDTTVTVQDGQTIVIGGLLRDDESIMEKRVPVLGKIPLLGWLFKRKIKTTEKISLVIFLTPRVVTTPQELKALTEEKRLETDEF